MEGWQQSRVASPGDALYKAAQSVGAQDLASQTNHFSSGYGDVWTMALVLKKCGVPCSAQNLQKTAETMGDINVPDDTYFGPIRFSAQSHFGETAPQFYKLDSTGNAITAAGPIQQTQ